MGVGRVAGIECSGSSAGGLETMGFSKRKHITAAWPPLAASIKMLELSYGIMKIKKWYKFSETNLVLE